MALAFSVAPLRGCVRAGPRGLAHKGRPARRAALLRARRGPAPAAQQGKSPPFGGGARAGQVSRHSQAGRAPFPAHAVFFKPSAGGRLRGKAPACAGVSRRARACRAVRGALGVSPRGLLALPGQRAARRRGRSRGCGPRPPMPRWMAPQWGAVCAARPAASGAQKSAPSPGALSYSISSRASSSVMPSATTCTAAPPASSSAPAIGGLP